MKAPEYIEIEMDGNFTSAVVSFGTGRKRRLTYKVLEKHTHLKTSITTIELERDIETDKPVKDTLTVGYRVKGLSRIRLASKVTYASKNGCRGCNFDTHVHPQRYVNATSTTGLCIKDWVKEGNQMPRENDIINVSYPEGKITEIQKYD